MATALASTVVVFTALVVVVVTSPGWDEFKAKFLDADLFRASLPDIAHAFVLNVKIFSISEVLILVVLLAPGAEPMPGFERLIAGSLYSE